MAGASRYDYLDHAISCKHCEEGFYWPPGADKAQSCGLYWLLTHELKTPPT